LDDTQRIALAAAERQDVVFCGVADERNGEHQVHHRHHHRRPAATFGSVQAGDMLYLSGNTGNSTEDARYDAVLSVTVTPSR